PPRPDTRSSPVPPTGRRRLSPHLDHAVRGLPQPDTRHFQFGGLQPLPHVVGDELGRRVVEEIVQVGVVVAGDDLSRHDRLAVGASALAPALASTPVVDPTVPAGRDVEPVVLTGASFPQWAAPAEVTAKAPSVAGGACTSGNNTCTHNTYEKPEVATGNQLGSGADVHKLLGYRWTGHKFVQIPFQVDELATRYISNNASTFSFYSETDQHPTYVFDQERFRWTKSDPADPCRAVADGPSSTPDPVPGLDTNDELAFMASDAGPQAPSDADVPKGIVGTSRVEVRDPLVPGKVSYVYVMLAGN